MARLYVEKNDPTRFPRFYNQSLIDEYAGARGYNIVNISRLYVRNDIEAFIKERGDSINLVRRALDGLYIDYRDSDTIEVQNNRDFIISNNTDYDTTIVTRDPKTLDKIRRDRVIIGKLKIYPNKTVIERDNIKDKIVNPNLFNTILITNPHVNNTRFYEKELKNKNFNIILVQSGKVTDRDYGFKLNQMDYLYNSLGGKVITYHTEKNDNYAYVIASENSRLKK